MTTLQVVHYIPVELYTRQCRRRNYDSSDHMDDLTKAFYYFTLQASNHTLYVLRKRRAIRLPIRHKPPRVFCSEPALYRFCSRLYRPRSWHYSRTPFYAFFVLLTNFQVSFVLLFNDILVLMDCCVQTRLVEYKRLPQWTAFREGKQR